MPYYIESREGILNSDLEYMFIKKTTTKNNNKNQSKNQTHPNKQTNNNKQKSNKETNQQQNNNKQINNQRQTNKHPSMIQNCKLPGEWIGVRGGGGGGGGGVMGGIHGSIKTSCAVQYRSLLSYINVIFIYNQYLDN